MQHRVEDIPLSTTKLISDIASYKAGDIFTACDCLYSVTVILRSAVFSRRCLNLISVRL